jgi:CHAD domain-containing protein
MMTGAPIAAERWLLHLERHLPIARRGSDPEGVHQMRVAIARLRVWLVLGGWHVLDDDLRWLRDGLAAVRDLDVQLAREPPATWATELLRRRSLARAELVSMLTHPRVPSLLAAIRWLPPIPIIRAQKVIPTLAHRLRVRTRAAQRHTRDPTPLHRLRCAVRRLRFALEWLGAEPTTLARAQTVLGDACDLATGLETLERAQGRGLRGYRHQLRHELRDARRHALDTLGDSLAPSELRWNSF